MTTKPTTATGYPSDQLALVRSTCLYVGIRCTEHVLHSAWARDCPA
jgi:hypothetical protein